MFPYNERIKEDLLRTLAINLLNPKYSIKKYKYSFFNIGDKVTFKTNRSAISKHSDDSCCWDPEYGVVIDKIRRGDSFTKNDELVVEEVLIIKLDKPHIFEVQGINTDIVFTTLDNSLVKPKGFKNKIRKEDPILDKELIKQYNLGQSILKNEEDRINNENISKGLPITRYDKYNVFSTIPILISSATSLITNSDDNEGFNTVYASIIRIEGKVIRRGREFDNKTHLIYLSDTRIHVVNLLDKSHNATFVYDSIQSSIKAYTEFVGKNNVDLIKKRIN